jgi:hypothetical protein
VYVRLLGPCFKTGRIPAPSHLPPEPLKPMHQCLPPPHPVTRARQERVTSQFALRKPIQRRISRQPAEYDGSLLRPEPEGPGRDQRVPPLLPARVSNRSCALLSRRSPGSYGRAQEPATNPDGCLSAGAGTPVHTRRISCSFNPPTGCFSVFPYGTCSLSVATLSYLALDGQHHPYSASTIKLTYSRSRPLDGDERARSCKTPYAPGNQPGLRARPLCGRPLRLHFPHDAMAMGIRSRAFPCSLAVTGGISVDFFSSAD